MSFLFTRLSRRSIGISTNDNTYGCLLGETSVEGTRGRGLTLGAGAGGRRPVVHLAEGALLGRRRLERVQTALETGIVLPELAEGPDRQEKKDQNDETKDEPELAEVLLRLGLGLRRGQFGLGRGQRVLEGRIGIREASVLPLQTGDPRIGGGQLLLEGRTLAEIPDRPGGRDARAVDDDEVRAVEALGLELALGDRAREGRRREGSVLAGVDLGQRLGGGRSGHPKNEHGREDHEELLDERHAQSSLVVCTWIS